ncbi:phage virion morphogenesis protein [Salmonella enterica subsp. enterica]|nr:phage virion morphogenesis protein [Salmonella enterica subsp. enterica serovar Essen]
MQLDFSIDDAGVRAAFSRLQQLGVDARPVMREAAAALADSTEQAFANEKDPETGAGWLSLTEKYRQRREKKGYTGKMLQMKGVLSMSINTGYSAKQAWIGSPLIYAPIHQLGGLPDMAPGPAAVPARPYLGLDNTGRGEIIDAVKRAVSASL